VKPAAAPFLWICGASGVGKSTVGWAVRTRVTATGVKTAYVDLDQIGFCSPVPPDDPERHALKAANLGAIWPNFRAAGAERLIVSGVVDAQDDVATYRDAVPGTRLTICRLRARADTLCERINLRGSGGGPPIPGDEIRGLPPEVLARLAADAVEEAAALDRGGIGDVCVDTDGLSVTEVAQAVLSRWS
jgi:predicted ABC-type ATPase